MEIILLMLSLAATLIEIRQAAVATAHSVKLIFEIAIQICVAKLDPLRE